MAWKERWQRLALPGAIALGISTIGATTALAIGTHTVQPGETLSEIAVAYDTSTADLAALNRIGDEDVVYAGDTLTIPESAPATVGPPAAAGAYRVRPGDTLDGIAAALGTTPWQLLALNPSVADPDTIFSGQTLRVPDPRLGSHAPRGEIAALLRDYALEYGLDPALVQALAWQESGWQQGAVSRAGALGVMQILPETADWIAADLVGAPLDVAGSANDNVLAGVAFLDWLLAGTGDEREALTAYVQGRRSVARDGIFPETEQYVDNVLAIRAAIVRYGAP